MNRRYSNAEQKERIRQRVRVQIDEENYQFFPERKDLDYYDNDVNQRVGVYVRVSTDDPRQTTSYELQKKYYEDFVVRHPKWTLVDIVSFCPALISFSFPGSHLGFDVDEQFNLSMPYGSTRSVYRR